MLEVKGLGVCYGKKTVLENIDLSFEKGRFTSVIGVNGCGKSTLLKTIVRVIPVKSGSILIDGTDARDLKRNEIAQRISYLPQGKNTPDMTVAQMVLHGRFPYLSYPRHYSPKDRDIAYSAMERMGVADLADTPISSLSGGMRQNAYIAMALAQDTDYILLDEPTTYLDISHQLELMKILGALAKEGKGIVAVTHDLPLAFEFSDEILLISGKDTVVNGTPEEISLSPIIREKFGVRIKMIAGERKYYYTN